MIPLIPLKRHIRCNHRLVESNAIPSITELFRITIITSVSKPPRLRQILEQNFIKYIERIESNQNTGEIITICVQQTL